MTPNPLSEPTPQFVPAQPRRLLDQVAQAVRQCRASEPTTAQLVCWLRAFVMSHGKPQPRELDIASADIHHPRNAISPYTHLYADCQRHYHVYVLHGQRTVYEVASGRDR